MSTMRTDARPFATAAAVAATVLATIAGVTVLGTTASAVDATVNPFDDAGGFSVYVIGDANLDSTELEGALAVGGTLRAATPGSRFPIVHFVAGTQDYTPPVIDGDTTRLLIGAFSTSSGIVDVSGAGNPPGIDKGFAKVVNPVLSFTERSGYVQYRDTAISGSEANGPVIDGKNHVYGPEGIAKFTAQGSSVAGYLGQGIGADAVTACLASPTAGTFNTVAVSEDGGKARLTLIADSVNIVNYGDLFFGGNYASEINYAGSVRPSASSPVIVRVPAGTTAVKGSTFGTSGQYAHYVMWDLSALTGAVTLTDKQGSATRIDGSIYAPHTDLTAYFGPLDGQVIAKTLTTPRASGELHSYMFNSSLTCSASTTSPSTSPSASPSTSPSVSPSTSPSTSPSVSPSTSPSVSPTSEPGETPTSEPTPSASSGEGGEGGEDGPDQSAEAEKDANGTLSQTGFGDIMLGWVAAAAVIGGAVLLGAVRRRRTS